MPVVVLPGDEERRTLERILSGSVAGVPLSLLLDVGSAAGPTAIRREGQERIARITADVGEGDLAGSVRDVRRAVREIDGSEGVRVRVAGGGLELHRIFRGLGFAFLLALFLIYMILAAQFDSFIHPFTIMLSLPLSVVGAFGGLFVSGMTLNIFSMIGVIMLMGLVTKNAILLSTSPTSSRPPAGRPRRPCSRRGRCACVPSS